MLALLLAVVAPLACHLIHSDRISGRDLAEAVPALTGLASDAQFGLSPLPGQQRLFRAADLKRIALAGHVENAAIESDVCFAWAVAVPDRPKMQAAMAETLRGRNPAIQIVESSLQPVPEGDFVFPICNLSTGSDKPAVWRGFVRYAGSRQFPIWARVLVTVKEQHVVAASNLSAADVLDATQLKLETYQGPVRHDKFLFDVDSAVGLVLRGPLTAGSPLLETMLEIPKEVNRGDVVNAIVENGAARLEVQAVAEDAGRKGQIISVRNPRSGRSFHARIEEKGTVLVVPGGPFGLVIDNKKS